MRKLIVIFLLLVSSTGFSQFLLPQTKYSPINGAGFIYKRHIQDSVSAMPLSSSPHIPYRMGGYRYNDTCKCIQLWDGTLWRYDNSATQLTDSSFIVGRDTIVIRGTALTLQQVLNNGSTLAENENIALLDSLVITSGKTVVDNLRVTSASTASDTAANKPAALDVNGNVVKMSSWPATGSGPGTYYATGAGTDPTFIVKAHASLIPTSTFVHGQPITWSILDNVTGHQFSFFDSVYGAATQGLTVRFPIVKNVITTITGPDDSFAGLSLITGATTAFSSLTMFCYQLRNIGMRLTGNGTSTWTKNSDFGTANFFSDMTTYSTVDGGTSFNVSSTGIDYHQMSIMYEGPNGYRVERQYAGTGAYNAKFKLMDAFGNPVTQNPTSSDNIYIINAGNQSRQINLKDYSSRNNDFINSGSNVAFIIDSEFEVWLAALPVSSTAIQVRWQPTYTNATNYKIYRATSLYGTRTLIHIGTEGNYTDTGLSANTRYWYFMIAVVSGVDTEITYFFTKTKSY